MIPQDSWGGILDHGSWIAILQFNMAENLPILETFRVLRNDLFLTTRIVLLFRCYRMAAFSENEGSERLSIAPTLLQGMYKVCRGYHIEGVFYQVFYRVFLMVLYIAYIYIYIYIQGTMFKAFYSAFYWGYSSRYCIR